MLKTLRLARMQRLTSQWALLASANPLRVITTLFVWMAPRTSDTPEGSVRCPAGLGCAWGGGCGGRERGGGTVGTETRGGESALGK